MNGCRQAQALCAWVVGPLVGLLALATPARASVFELFGGDPRGIAMAGALVAATEGAEAAFYNPAALVEAPTNGMQIGFAQTHLPMDIHLIRPVCSDDAATCRARFGRQSSRHAPLLPEGGRHFQLGWHARHLRVLGGRLAFGALLTLPSTRLVRLSGPDAAQPHFVVYESLPDRLSVLLASGIRINDRVAVGVGVQVLAALGSELDLGLDPATGRIEPGTVQISLQPSASLTAGVSLRPGFGLRLGLGFRQEVSLRYRIPTRLGVGPLLAADLLVAQNTLYSPTTLELGAAWRSQDNRVLIAASVRMAMWSEAPDPSPRLEIDIGGGVAGDIGVDEQFDIGRDTAQRSPGFGDTVTPAVAAELWPKERLCVRGGYSFRPSPAPRAIGLTNQLDNDAHIIGLGAEVGLGDSVLERAAAKDEQPRQRHAFYFRAAGQVQLLPRRTVYKRDPNDPVGDLDHGGAAVHVALHFGARF